MPNRDVHVKVGVGVGVAATLTPMVFYGEKVTFEDACFRILGAAFGGYFGARIPDIIDPSSNGPNHRSVGHGVVPNSALYAYVLEIFLEKRKKLLHIDGHQNHYKNQFLIGVMDGLAGGHFSHLALDARTPKGLPIFV